MEMPKLDRFTRAFLECALWSSTDESRDDGGDPLDDNYTIDDIDPLCVSGLLVDCARFQEEMSEALSKCYGRITRSPEMTDSEQAGHDFWLTRNGHGAGFWDGDWPEPHATSLTEASKRFGEVYLYVGDDGVIYAAGYENGPESKASA